MIGEVLGIKGPDRDFLILTPRSLSFFTQVYLLRFRDSENVRVCIRWETEQIQDPTIPSRELWRFEVERRSN